jgi:hypothetical protein
VAANGAAGGLGRHCRRPPNTGPGTIFSIRGSGSAPCNAKRPFAYEVLYGLGSEKVHSPPFSLSRILQALQVVVRSCRERGQRR